MSSLVVDAQTGEILTANKPDQQNYPASLTKMMTLYLTFEAIEAGKLKLNAPLHISGHAAAQAPSKLGLHAGGTIKLDDAIRGIAVKSANDAAVVVGEALGKSEARFAQLMTAKARALGMKDTTFRNASGLPNRSQVTTARDMAILAIALRRDFPKFYHYFSEVKFTYNGATYINHNHMLGKVDGVDGVKTGYIRASGFNIATSAERRGHRIVGVVLGGTSPSVRDKRMSALLNKGFKLAATQSSGARAKLFPVATTRSATVKLDKAIEKATIAVARKPASAPDTDLAEASVATMAARDWSVQVGAFSRPGSAKLAAARARKHVVALKGKQISIERAEGDDDDSELYRARVVGLTQTVALKACDRLKRKKIACLVVPPTDNATVQRD